MKTGIAAPRPGRQVRRRQSLPGADEGEERGAEDDRQARRGGETEQEPGDELAWLDAERPPVRRLDGRLDEGRVDLVGVSVIDLVPVFGGLRVGADRDADGQEGQPDRDDVGLVPGGRDLGRVPEDRPEGEEDRRAESDDDADRQPSDRPPAERDVDRGEDQ